MWCKISIVFLFLNVIRIQGQLTLGRIKEGDKCDTGGGVLGTCQEVSKCLSIGGVLERNGSPAKVCAVIEGKHIVCCRQPYVIAAKLCNAWRSYWRSNEGQCIRKEHLVVGGVEAKVGQIPHIGLIGVETNRKVNWLCGGSLISPHFVLTAAHCYLGPGNYVVRFGEHDIFRKNKNLIDRVVGHVPPGLYKENDLHFEKRFQIKTEQVIRVAKFIRHPDFEPTGLYNDVALLLLQEPVILTKRVLPACLPTDPNDDFMNRNLTAAGWGKLHYYKNKPSRYLQKVTLPTIENVVCLERLLKENPALIPKGITSDQLCAGEDGKDTCQGDSGGPLVIQMGNRTLCEHTDVGIVSFGNGCGNYGIYTRVSSYVDWITSYIAPQMIPRV